MAIKTITVHVRLVPSLKNEVEKILKNLGLSHSDVVGKLYNIIKLNKGLPFAINTPNELTANTLAKADQGEALL